MHLFDSIYFRYFDTLLPTFSAMYWLFHWSTLLLSSPKSRVNQHESFSSVIFIYSFVKKNLNMSPSVLMDFLGLFCYPSSFCIRCKISATCFKVIMSICMFFYCFRFATWSGPHRDSSKWDGWRPQDFVTGIRSCILQIQGILVDPKWRIWAALVELAVTGCWQMADHATGQSPGFYFFLP